jgi:hypothetical protein
VESQIRRDQRNLGQPIRLVLRRAADENAVPVNLQVGPHANALRAHRQLVGEIGGDRPGSARRKSHVIDYLHPLAVLQRFDVGRYGRELRLVRGIHAGRAKVFDFTMRQQPQRASVVRLAKIEFQAVHFGEAEEGKNFEIAEVAMLL